jgi:hypothetical protein
MLSRNVKIKIHKIVILPVILYGCETSSLTLKEEHELRVFENRVLIRVFGPKRDEVTGGWRKLHNEELHGNILVGGPEGRRPLGRPKRRWEDNIKMDLREIGFGGVDWIHLPQDRGRWRAVVNTVMNLLVP